MSDTTKILLVSILVAIFGIVALFLFVDKGDKGDENKVQLPIEVIEYSDFQCPACSAYYPFVKDIKAKFGDKMKFTYKHYPLESIHDRAFPAAVASEAAREQGKFEEFHDKLFENQANLTDEDFFKYATEIGLDVEKFKTDYKENKSLAERVRKDMEEGNGVGVGGTPTFFVNDRKFSGSPQELEERIAKLIELAEAPPAQE